MHKFHAIPHPDESAAATYHNCPVYADMLVRALTVLTNTTPWSSARTAVAGSTLFVESPSAEFVQFFRGAWNAS